MYGYKWLKIMICGRQLANRSVTWEIGGELAKLSMGHGVGGGLPTKECARENWKRRGRRYLSWEDCVKEMPVPRFEFANSLSLSFANHLKTVKHKIINKSENGYG